MIKRRKQNSWFEKAAREMDIDLDEQELYLLLIVPLGVCGDQWSLTIEHWPFAWP